MNSIRVVFSIDLIITRSFGVIGEFACLRGLKFRMEFKILLEVWGRDRMRMDSVFKVASIRMASLQLSVEELQPRNTTYPELSWKTDSRRSSRPDASASRFRGTSNAWFKGIMAKETSEGSPRYKLLTMKSFLANWTLPVDRLQARSFVPSPLSAQIWCNRSERLRWRYPKCVESLTWWQAYDPRCPYHRHCWLCNGRL
jgi:hypothetical protein